MKRKEVPDSLHGKWLVVRWEDFEVLKVCTSASEANEYATNLKLCSDDLVIIEQFIKEKYVDPFPKEVRSAVEKFRAHAKVHKRPRDMWLLATLDKYYPVPPPVPKQ